MRSMTFGCMSGTCTNTEVVNDQVKRLGQAAIDAVKQWKFKPATMNGEPVDVIFNLTTNFELGEVRPQP